MEWSFIIALYTVSCIHTSLIGLFCLVVVAHNSKLRVVNVDTVFWLEDHSPLGKVRAWCMMYDLVKAQDA